MKRCPVCNKKYSDETLNFCLDDGEWLTAVEEESAMPTAILPGNRLASEAPTRILKNSQDDDKEARALRNTLTVSLGIMLLAALAFGGFWYYNRSASKKITAMAVMPFTNASGNPDVEYLADGITESLIGSLSGLPDLSVKSRSSVFRFKGKDADARELGRELGVQALLTGRVVQRDRDLTLYIELVDAASDNSIWQQTYNRPMTSLVALQSDIARDVAEQLRAELSGADKKKVSRNYTENAEAYSLYLLGRFHWGKRTKADAYKAIEYYREAVVKDPNYALAFAGLSDVYSALQGYDKNATRETREMARSYALRAIAMDDSLSEAHVSLGVVTYGADFDFVEAERLLKRAIELDPNNSAGYQSYGYLLMALGRFDESEANYRKALSIDPASPNVNRGYSLLMMIMGRYQECENQLRKALELDPNFQIGYLSLANAQMLQGRYAESVENFAKAREVARRPDNAAAMRASFARGGWHGFVMDLETNDWLGDPTTEYIDACRMASIGENKLALDRLEKAYEDREGFVVLINVDPRLKPLQAEPRFAELLRKVGFIKTP